MVTPEILSKSVQAYKMPKPPALLWYIQAEHARLELVKQLQLLCEKSEILVVFEWINGGLLLIVWETSTPEDLMVALTHMTQEGHAAKTMLAR